MRMKACIAVAVMLLVSHLGWSQTKNITGQVTDQQNGKGLQGVTVISPNSKISALTNAEGNFLIQIPEKTTSLIFTYVGYVTKEEKISGTSVNVTLAVGDNQLTEVVMTGYRAQNKKSFTGAAGVVAGEKLRSVPIASFDQALQGTTPGLLMRASSGQPGNSGSILIRGVGSITGSTSPIFIVDGIQIAATDFAALNPNDIENVTVLKDAVAASTYGSRGANGVIVVTTRRGKAGKTSFEIDAYTGWSTFPSFRDYRLMNSAEKIAYELRRGGTSLEDYTPAEIDSLGKINTSWEDELTRTARTNSINASASGGTEKTRYFASVNYFKQEGVLRNTGYDRITGRINLSQDAGNFLFGMNVTGSVNNYTNTAEDNTAIASPLNGLQWANPYEQPFEKGVKRANGNFTLLRYNAAVAANPALALLRSRVTETGQPLPTTELFENSNESLGKRILASGNVEYKIPFISGLSVKTVYGVDYRQYEDTRFVERYTYSAGSNPRPLSGSFSNFRTSSFNRDFRSNARTTMTSSLNFAKKFGDHSFDVGAYYETIDQKDNNSGRTVYLLQSPFRNEAGATINADLLPRVRTGGGESSIQSYFGLLSYGYKNRYFINANFRNDASSRFGSEKREANFGGVGVSWMLSEEAFMSSLKNGFVNDLKLRASYGTVGSQDGIGFYQSQAIVGGRTYNSAAGIGANTLQNPDLQWEERTKFNLGLDYSLFGNKVSGAVDYYNETTNNLFLPFELSRTTGFSTLTKNVGSVRNSGVEFSVLANVLTTRDFKVSINANITYNKNSIVKLADKDTIVSGILARIVGQPVNSLFLVKYAGVDPATGYSQYFDLAGKITTDYNVADRTVVGNNDPNVFGGFGTNMSYKGFAISAQFTYALNSKVFNNERDNIENPDYYYDNMNADLLKEWQKPGDITSIPRPDVVNGSENVYQSSTTRFVEDNSFVRLRNLSLQYSLPKSLTDKIKMAGISFYVNGTNLWTATKYRGRDPEFSGGLVNAQYPALKTWQAGLRLNF